MNPGREAGAARAALGAAVAVLALAPAVLAQGAAPGIEAGHRTFAADYVAAVNAGDAERMRKLTHPRSLACVTDESRDFFDDVLARSLRRKLTSGYRLVRVKRVEPGEPPGVPPAMGAYPVPPTHRIQIDAGTGSASSITILRDLAAVNGVWLVVLPCPTPEGLQAFRAAKQAGAAQDAEAKELVAALGDPLRAELVGLMKEGRRLDAVKRYRAATGEDLAMARRVVELLP